MCGDPREMLDGALAGMAWPERLRFESDFQHFSSYSRLYPAKPEKHALDRFPLLSLEEFEIARAWARWAFWSAGNYGRKG